MRVAYRVDAFWLKIAMAVLMLLDHLYYPLGGRYPALYWGHIAARVVAPVFCYLMTEGMRYTRSRTRYIFRLWLAGAIMQAGNALLTVTYETEIPNNIFLPLAIGATLIYGIDLAVERAGWVRGPIVLGCTVLFFASYPCEGGFMIPLMALIFYYLRAYPAAMWLTYFGVFCAGEVGIFLAADWTQGSFGRVFLEQLGWISDQFWMILAIFPILLYSGKRGLNNAFAKGFFYIFYPVHIWLIYLWEWYTM